MLDSDAVNERARTTIPWMLVVGSAILFVLVLYVIFGAYLPTKQRVALLEAELKQLYRREAELQTKLAQIEQRTSGREKALTAERDELARRLGELQSQLPPAKPR